MSINHGEWRKPPVSEITKSKPKTGVAESKVSPSSEHKPTISEKLRDLIDKARNRINKIFADREPSDQPPQETLQELAATKIPQDTQKSAEPTTDQTPENNPQPTQETETPSTVESPPIETTTEKSPEPIVYDNAADQAEMAHLREAIRNLQTEEPLKPEAVQPVQSIDFYRNSLLSSEKAEKLAIPPETLALIEDPQQKTFYQNVSKLDNPELQKICFKKTSYDSDIPNYFSEKGEPKVSLFIDYYLENKVQISNREMPSLSDEQLSKLSQTDQEKIKTTEYVLSLDKQLGLEENSLFPSLKINNYRYEGYLDSDNQPNSLFFKTIFSSHDTPNLNRNQTEQLTSLIRTRLETFSDTDKKLWMNILSLKETDYGLINFMVKYSSSTFFNEASQPTDNLFQKIVLDCPVFQQDFFASNLTPEVLASFSPENQKFWKNFIRLKSLDKHTSTYIFSISRRNTNIYFTENHQAKESLFISLIKDDLFQQDFFASNLTPEVLASFSPENQKFWKNFIRLKNVDSQMAKTIILSQANIDTFFTEDGQPTSDLFKCLALSNQYQSKAFNANLTQKTLDSFSHENQRFWKNLPNLNNIDSKMVSFLVSGNVDIKLFFNEQGQPTSYFFETLAKNSLFQTKFFTSNFTSEVLASFSSEDQKLWKNITNLNNIDSKTVEAIISFTTNPDILFNQNGQPKSSLFEVLAKNGLSHSEFFASNLTSEVLASFSSEDQKLWSYLTQSGVFNNDEFMSTLFSEERLQFIENGEINQSFYDQLASKYPIAFINTQDRNLWKATFSDEIINELLNNLPRSSDEKRNAFTHNPYDRTSEFFKFLSDHSSQTNFRLDVDHVKIASEYIKKYGLSKSAEFYNYFQSLYRYQQGNLETLPDELINNHITSIEELTKSMETVQRKCFSSEPITDASNLTPFELNLLSITTGHSANRWTRIPLETIVSDFSTDLSNGLIAPISPEFHSETIKSASISIETDKKISDSPKLVALSQEILASINSPNDVSLEKTTISELFNQRVESLSQEVQQSDPTKAKKQEFIQKQIDAFKQKVSDISESQSIDQLLNSLVTFNLNLGEDQEKFNSVLRQLVFKKVFDKHQNSPGWQESIIASLREDSSTVDAVNNMTNLINNTIKDHVLNFETNNQDGYWDQSTFETVKKYSSVFKKNLGFSSFVNELNSYQESFVITNLSQDQTIQMIPDRGLIGEMSGYMADVCYTKVYPLLKQYPDLTPYKFIANPESNSPEFIGSTLVFKVKDTDDQPVFLIRAFDIPNEKSVDIGKFFESFVDHLTPIAQKMGIKKIITASTPGTISNYPTTINYVRSNYVTGKIPVPLKDKFDFNGYDITNKCYQVRDIK